MKMFHTQLGIDSPKAMLTVGSKANNTTNTIAIIITGFTNFVSYSIILGIL